jgi:hypothetical protein
MAVEDTAETSSEAAVQALLADLDKETASQAAAAVHPDSIPAFVPGTIRHRQETLQTSPIIEVRTVFVFD